MRLRTSSISFSVDEDVPTWCEINCYYESFRKKGRRAYIPRSLIVYCVAANSYKLLAEISLMCKIHCILEKVYCYDKSGTDLVYHEPSRIDRVAWNKDRILVKPNKGLVGSAVYQARYVWTKDISICVACDSTCSRAAVRGFFTAFRLTE